MVIERARCCFLTFRFATTFSLLVTVLSISSQKHSGYSPMSILLVLLTGLGSRVYGSGSMKQVRKGRASHPYSSLARQMCNGAEVS